ncbi:GIY-YIG nuclease family protein [uncultured Hyphomicrobium sp.]|uniref:GIY-YIG nuclease family protein n=1 Tax=uncultured Hyphomicrobium sp. TaxID=194373 RepID=UPI0025D262E3|nr:GIY-YIG nuclease family protein [uncultured Hyphomicrobium sp.]
MIGEIRSEVVRAYFVYIVASKPYGTLYIGVTNDIVRRAVEHRDGLVPGFTKKYAVKVLVHLEAFADVSVAIQREKSLKRWPREWKTNLIERTNPHWEDLLPGLMNG